MRRQNRFRLPFEQNFRPLGDGRQTVPVDQKRPGNDGGEFPDELGRFLLQRKAGAHHHHIGLFRQRQQIRFGFERKAKQSRFPLRQINDFASGLGDKGNDRRGRRQPRVPSARFQKGHRGKIRRAEVVAASGDKQNVSHGAFIGLGGTRGQRRHRAVGLHRQRVPLIKRRRERNMRHRKRPAMFVPGVQKVPELRQTERHRVGRANRRAHHLSAVAGDAGGDVQAHHRPAAGVDERNHIGGQPPDVAVQPRAENRVHHNVGGQQVNARLLGSGKQLNVRVQVA